jgi:hypothetical protein
MSNNRRVESVTANGCELSEDSTQVQRDIASELATHKAVFSQIESCTPANQSRGGSYGKHPMLEASSGTVTEVSIDNQVMSYLTMPKQKRNRILLDGRVVNPEGETVRDLTKNPNEYWKDALIKEGVESIEI